MSGGGASAHYGRSVAAALARYATQLRESRLVRRAERRPRVGLPVHAKASIMDHSAQMKTVGRNGAIAKIALVALLVLACAVAMTAFLPEPAQALETSSCTARPNRDGTSDVQGATETRITWEGKTDPDEQIEAISLTLPEGTSFDTEDARATVLGGEDHMDRLDSDVTFSSEGQTITATFAEPTQAGAHVRLEIYGVLFPMGGGDMQLTGTCEFADGTTAEIADIPPITVIGITLFEQWGNQLAEQQWVKDALDIPFVRLFVNPVLMVQSLPTVFNGFLLAIGTVAVAFPLAIPIGFLFSLMRMSKFRVLRGIASLYVNIVRGTPLFLQIYIAFLGLPLAGITIPRFPLGVLVLCMNSGAYLCEIFRAGIQSIPKGQFEASRSLGMNGAQTMLFVIVPQTVRRVIPTVTSEFILLYKDTSMLAAVGVMDIVLQARTIVANTGSITPYVVAALFYLVITLPLTKIVGMLEERLATSDTGGSPKRRRRSKKGSTLQQKENELETETRDAEAAQRGNTGTGGITPEQFSSL